MKPEKIFAKIHDAVTDLLEQDNVDVGLVVSSLGVLYVALCKHSEIDAVRACDSILGFWDEIGVIDVEDVELLN